jgi:hypothetical protein
LKRPLLLATGLVGALLPLVGALSGPAHAVTGVGGTDPANDVVDSTVGCYAPPGAGAAGCPAANPTATPGYGQLDIRGWNFSAASGHIDANVSVGAGWPREGDPASVLPGVTELEVRWIFDSDAQTKQYTVGETCTNKDQDTDAIVTKYNVKYNAPLYCTALQEGPFFDTDGYRLFVGLTASVVNGTFHYDWEYGWLEEASQFFFSSPGSATHDVVSSDPGLLNGTKIDNAPNSSFGGSSFTLHVPYKLMDTQGDDGDQYTPPDLTHTFLEPNQLVHGVTVGTFANVTVSEPNPPLCPARDDGYQALDVDPNGLPHVDVGDLLGGAIAPVLRGGAPQPLNDPTNCVSQGAGVTFQADWAPGNPYTGGGPSWGGYIPRAFPRALSYAFGTGAAQPGLGTCAYPAGFLEFQPWYTYGAVQPLLDENFNYEYLDGLTVTIDGTPLPGVPGVPTSVNGVSLRPNLRVNNPAVNASKKCGNVSTNVGFYYENASGAFQAG